MKWGCCLVDKLESRVEAMELTYLHYTTVPENATEQQKQQQEPTLHC